MRTRNFGEFTVSNLRLLSRKSIQAGLGACLFLAFLTSGEVRYCHATCGDYLMPLQASSRMNVDGHHGSDRKDCHGPGCGSAPVSDFVFAVAVSTNPHQLTLAAANDSDDVCPHLPCVGRCSIDSCLCTIFVQGELFRPPCIS